MNNKPGVTYCKKVLVVVEYGCPECCDYVAQTRPDGTPFCPEMCLHATINKCEKPNHPWRMRRNNYEDEVCDVEGCHEKSPRFYRCEKCRAKNPVCEECGITKK